MQAANAFLPRSQFQQIHTSYDSKKRALWYWIDAKRPCFTLELLRELQSFQEWVRAQVSGCTPDDSPIHYLVGASATPGLFNLGGDLVHFIRLIRERNHADLTAYARACVEVLYGNASHLDSPMITISLVQGRAQGGGFEAALSSNVVVAERQAKMGFPEVLFNMMPGMGAYSLLSRRVDAATTERIMTSGLTYSAEQLKALGIVDVVADDDGGERAVDDYISQHMRRRNAYLLLGKIRHRVNPLTLSELYDVSELWTDAALRITERDLRVMERFASMQESMLTKPGQADSRRNDVVTYLVPAVAQQVAAAAPVSALSDARW